MEQDSDPGKEARFLMMDKETTPTIKILIATHLPYRMPEDPMYIPVQAGSAIAKDKDGAPLDLGIQRDDEGDNISAKNAQYCELTALYWGYKNLDADYIGLCHYRRHFGWPGKMRAKDPFDRIVKEKEISPMLGKIRIFVPRKRHYVIETLYSHYQHAHYVGHLHEARKILEKQHPEYLPTYDRVLKETSGYMFNMAIMDRELCADYGDLLFPLLEELEKKIDVSQMSFYQGRYCGRVSEIIYNVWIAYQLETGRVKKNEVMELPYVLTEPVDYKKKVTTFLRAKFLHKKYEF